MKNDQEGTAGTKKAPLLASTARKGAFVTVLRILAPGEHRIHGLLRLSSTTKAIIYDSNEFGSVNFFDSATARTLEQLSQFAGLAPRFVTRRRKNVSLTASGRHRIALDTKKGLAPMGR